MGKIRRYLLDMTEKNNWPVTFSIGVVTCRRHPCNIDQFLKAADDLMYSVKKSGKNMTRYKDLDA
ncbi:MAG: diguanylate cyclase [bacterium]